MTEPNEIEFHERVKKPVDRSRPMRVGIVAGTALLVLVGAVAVMGASPAPSPTTTDPGASAAPGTTKTDGGVGKRGDRFGRIGFHDITISAINGSDLSLKTDDGWTRTISVASTTTITKGGATITAGDLAVGDQIQFGQTKGTDGTYTITAIRVILPTIAGTVTAIDGNTLTVTQRDGTTATIHVDGATTYKVQGATAPTLADIKVGSRIVAEGTLRTDGSLDAAAVGSGFRGRDGHGPKGNGGDKDDAAPNATPAPSTNPS